MELQVVVTPEQERALCDPVGVDGTPHVAYLSGPSEIALKKNSGWILLSVNSGRLEDAVEAVLSLRARDEAAVQTAFRAAALVQNRLSAWPFPTGEGGRWPYALWSVFKHNLVAEVAAVGSPEPSAEC